MRTRQTHVLHPDTISAVTQRQNGSLRALARELNFPPSYAATLSDVSNDKPGALTAVGENHLRRALGLPVLQTRQARACPSCGIVHGEGIDCGGRRVKVVLRNLAPDWVTKAAALLADPGHPRREPDAEQRAQRAAPEPPRTTTSERRARALELLHSYTNMPETITANCILTTVSTLRRILAGETELLTPAGITRILAIRWLPVQAFPQNHCYTHARHRVEP